MARVLVRSLWVAAAWLWVSRVGVEGHGKIVVPPGRGSIWRFGHDVPANYDDDGNFCGGYSVQWLLNDGKCGVCGDAYHLKERNHEAGGKFYSGIISNAYKQGQAIDILINVTANHRGYFEFRVCPSLGDNKTEVTQECLDKHLLKFVDGSGTQFQIPTNSSEKQQFLLKVKLPPNLTCKHCVLQWHWRTANFWGLCDNETGALGCGPQETYRNCADIAIKAARNNPGSGLHHHDDGGDGEDDYDHNNDATRNALMLRFALNPAFGFLQQQLIERHQRHPENHPYGRFVYTDPLVGLINNAGP